MDRFEHIYAAYTQAAGRWKGCDWSTRFGFLSINLEGITSAQAALAAEATAGKEASEWETLSAWLTQVERDAQEAETRAQQAVTCALAGNLGDALKQAQHACALESHYPRAPVWQSLLTAITAALMSEGERHRDAMTTITSNTPTETQARTADPVIASIDQDWRQGEAHGDRPC